MKTTKTHKQTKKPGRGAAPTAGYPSVSECGCGASRVAETGPDFSAAQPPATLAAVWAGFLELQRLQKEQFAEWKRRGEEEDRRRAEEEKRRAEAEKREEARWAEEAKRRAEEEKRRAEEEAKRRAEEEAKREAAYARDQRAAEKRMNKLESIFVGEWGKLMERLVEGDLVRLLRGRGINIMQTSSRRHGRLPNGENFEFDIIAHDGDTIVVVEVKTTLRPDDVKEFLYRLDHARELLPEYANKKIHGAVGFLSEESESATMAERRGLFVIRATGSSAAIINDPGFSPKLF